MEEAKIKVNVNKRKTEGTNNLDNDGEVTKKQKTEEKKQDSTIIFSKMTCEEARKFLDNKPGIPWLIRESSKPGLITIQSIKRGEQIAIRYMLVGGEWIGCPKDEKELAALMEKMTPLDCISAENHLNSFYEKLKSTRLEPKYLVKPNEIQQSKVQAYKGYGATFFPASSEWQERQQLGKPEKKIGEEKLSDEVILDPKMGVQYSQ